MWSKVKSHVAGSEMNENFIDSFKEWCSQNGFDTEVKEGKYEKELYAYESDEEVISIVQNPGFWSVKVDGRKESLKSHPMYKFEDNVMCLRGTSVKNSTFNVYLYINSDLEVERETSKKQDPRKWS